jgi:serine/threonine protein kinase
MKSLTIQIITKYSWVSRPLLQYSNFMIVMEYIDGGELIWKDEDETPVISLQDAKSYLRDIIVGLDYRTYRPWFHFFL